MEMVKRLRSIDFLLGCLCLLFSLLLIFIWIPLDTESGILERIRSRRVVGDAMAPSIAAALLGLAGMLLCIESIRNKLRRERSLGKEHLFFLCKLLIIITISILLMRWIGPSWVTIFAQFNHDMNSYRELRDTVPWKYLGYLCGGSFLIFSLIALVEHRLRWRSLLIALAATVILIAIYDLPFEDLLLPPNGDV